MLIVSNCEAGDYTFLRKYSYICINIANGTVINSTCFFYKGKSQIFLVNNYHALTGLDVFTAKQIFKVDTLQIIYPVRNSLETSILKVPVKIDNIIYKKFYDRPDIIGYPVNLPVDADINFINEIIDSGYLGLKPNEVFSFGYPANLQSWNSINQTLLYGNYEEDFVPLQTLMQSDIAAMPEENMPDFFSKIKKLNFFISALSEPGRSGSPVFGKFIEHKNGDENCIYKFIGVIFGQEEHIGKTWAIKGSVVNDYLKSLDK